MYSKLELAEIYASDKRPWESIELLQRAIDYPKDDVEKADVGEFQKLLHKIKFEFPDWEVLEKQWYISCLLRSAKYDVEHGWHWRAIRTLSSPFSEEKYISEPKLDLKEITEKLADLKAMFPNWERDELTIKLNSTKVELDCEHGNLVITRVLKYLSLPAFIFGIFTLFIIHFNLQAFIERSQSSVFKFIEISGFLIIMLRIYSGVVYTKLLLIFVGWALSFILLEFVYGSNIPLPVDLVNNSEVFLSVLAGKFLIFWSPVIWYFARQSEIEATECISDGDEQVKSISSQLQTLSENHLPEPAV